MRATISGSWANPVGRPLLPDTNTIPNLFPMATQSNYRFAFGPWNIHEGADPFGPTVRPTVAFAKKLSVYKELGFEGIEFHDDDAVPDVDKKNPRS